VATRIPEGCRPETSSRRKSRATAVMIQSEQMFAFPADVIWPGLYIMGARYMWLAILLSLLLEWLIFWPAMRTRWWRALAATVGVNAVSLLCGILFACLSVFATIPFRTFSTVDWVCESLLIGALSGVVEWVVFRQIARRWKDLAIRFYWVMIANILSTFLCLAFVPGFDLRRDYNAPPKGMGTGQIAVLGSLHRPAGC
jgi:hypothetical protein